MAFIEKLLVFSTKPISAVVNQSTTVTVSTPEQLLSFPLLISDPVSHPIGHESPSIAIADNTIYIDCTERQARSLGCTFASLTCYKSRCGLRRGRFVISNYSKLESNERFHLVLNRLLTEYGPFQCRVPLDDGVEMDHFLNIHAQPMPDFDPKDPQEIIQWTGMTSLQVKSCMKSNTPIHVYSVRNSLIDTKSIKSLIDTEGVICVVAQSAKSCADLSSLDHHSGYFLFKHADSIHSVNFN